MHMSYSYREYDSLCLNICHIIVGYIVHALAILYMCSYIHARRHVMQFNMYKDPSCYMQCIQILASVLLVFITALNCAWNWMGDMSVIALRDMS